jgi:GntR family transcriptional repressor for pyruvate dehydrogenase complex
VFDPDVVTALLDSHRSSDLLAEYVECRRILEVEAAGLAAERASKTDTTELAAAFARMEEIAKRPQSRRVEELFHEADVAFHEALIRATGNRALGRLIDRLHPVLVLARFKLARPRYWEDRALPEHRRILEAVANGDAIDAREAMTDHLATIATYLGDHRKTTGRPRTRRAVAP